MALISTAPSCSMTRGTFSCFSNLVSASCVPPPSGKSQTEHVSGWEEGSVEKRSGSFSLPGVTWKKNIRRENFHRTNIRFVTLASVGGGAETANGVTTAGDAVNEGLTLFKKGRVSEALEKFSRAMELNPTTEEAQAALYNMACCYASRQDPGRAATALKEALGRYELRFSTVLGDPDMAAFRATPEFTKLQKEAREGSEAVGSSFRSDLKLISEVQAPFRAVRKFLYVGLGMAAGISTFLTVPRLISAMGGGEGAPDLVETLGNTGINVGGGAVLLALFLWEQKREEAQLSRVARDVTLSRLPLRLASSRTVELNQLRGTTRPIVLAGKKETVEKSLAKAEKFRSELLERGVLLVPLIWTDLNASLGKVSPPPKRGFGPKSTPKINTIDKISNLEEEVEEDEFERKAKETALRRAIEADKKFRAEIVSPGEWQQWVIQQQQSEGVLPGEDVFLLLRLDGRLRKSGRGMPDWVELVRELPPVDSFVSKLER